MIFSMMVAMGNNRVIGHKNSLPWHLPADMAFFKRTTMGKAILMGRKTYDSIGRALPGRENMVLSRQQDLKISDCKVISNIQQAMQYVSNELVCIGGAQLYHQCLPLVTRIYLTEVFASFDGDTFFPVLDTELWQRVKYDPHKADEKNHWDYAFSTWERK